MIDIILSAKMYLLVTDSVSSGNVAHAKLIMSSL